MTAMTTSCQQPRVSPPVAPTAAGAGPAGLRVVCVCSDDEYLELRRALRLDPDPHVVPAQRTAGPPAVAPAQAKGRNRRRRHELVRLPDSALRDLLAAVGPAGADVVALGVSQLQEAQAPQAVRLLQGRGVRVRAARSFAEHLSERVALDRLPADWFLFDVRQHHHRTYRAMSWVLDMTAALVALGALVLVGPLVALAVKATSPGPVLYRQRRVGRHGKIFHIVKFRTMRLDAEADGARFAGVGDARITSVGAFLRKSRLDELPQGWNLLRRDMALIGPRPERPEFTVPYAEVIPHYSQRQVLRPGLTGWAQVSEGYSNDLAGTVRKLERDLYYLKYQGPRLDLKVLRRTVGTVLGLQGR